MCSGIKVNNHFRDSLESNSGLDSTSLDRLIANSKFLKVIQLCFPESELKSWAHKYEYTRDESAIIDLRNDIQKSGCLTKDQLRQIARWKATRSAGHIEKNQDGYVKEISAWSFSANQERSRIEVLTLLDGVMWPTASVILHLFHKEPYPILDFRALWSVNLEVPQLYSFSFWWEYVQFCRTVAKRNSIDMRTLDRALWQYSKEKQEV